MAAYKTIFGSLAKYNKGGVEVIADNPKNYVFSNVFEVASKSKPYERVAVAKNFEFVIECLRAEGQSAWYTAAHDEFALCMDGAVEVSLWKLDKPEAAAPKGSDGAVRLPGEPAGRKMGRIVLGKGHQALLPTGAAYRFQAQQPGVLLIQTVQGRETLERWPQICQLA
ncbi:MAG TPA: hydroxyquinol 1,2-dioxygenase [bacterium]|nr:hydroxyquinol 1,2-dioxygenase [bacterium]